MERGLTIELTLGSRLEPRRIVVMNRDWALQWGGRTAAVTHSTVRPAAMVGLWLLFYSSLFSWWLAMATLFAQHAYITAVVVAYAMPSLYAAVVFVSARWRASRNLPQFGVLAVALIAHVVVWLAVGGGVPAQVVGALVGVG